MNKNKDSRQNAADSIDANIQRIEIDLTPFNKEPDWDNQFWTGPGELPCFSGVGEQQLIAHRNSMPDKSRGRESYILYRII